MQKLCSTMYGMSSVCVCEVIIVIVFVIHFIYVRIIYTYIIYLVIHLIRFDWGNDGVLQPIPAKYV